MDLLAVLLHECKRFALKSNEVGISLMVLITSPLFFLVLWSGRRGNPMYIRCKA